MCFRFFWFFPRPIYTTYQELKSVHQESGSAECIDELGNIGF